MSSAQQQPQPQQSSREVSSPRQRQEEQDDLSRWAGKVPLGIISPQQPKLSAEALDALANVLASKVSSTGAAADGQSPERFMDKADYRVVSSPVIASPVALKKRAVHFFPDSLKLTIDSYSNSASSSSAFNSYPPTPVASPVDLEVFPRDLSYVSPRDMKKMEPSLAPVYEQDNMPFERQLHEKLVQELHVVFENAQRLDEELSIAEAIAFEQFRMDTLEEAHAAQEDYVRLQSSKIAVELSDIGRNEKCIEQPWFSRRPRELVVEEMYELGQKWQRYPQYVKAVLLEEEERIRRETLDEYAYVQSQKGSLSWADLDLVEERARKEKLNSYSVEQEVEACYARVLDEFESFVEGIERSKEGYIANELMELERLRKLVLLESEDALAEFQRTEIKRSVVSLEEQERLDRIVRDCSTDYRSVQFAEVTPVLEEIRKLAEKIEKAKNQGISVQLIEEERSRRILASAGQFSISRSSH